MSDVRPTFTAGGCLAALDAGEDSLLQYPATELEPGRVQVYLRVREEGRWVAHGLLGPGSGSRVRIIGPAALVEGEWNGLTYRLAFTCDGPRWAWRWEVRADDPAAAADGPGGARTVDVVHTHDPALAPVTTVRRNELYVSQYLDVTPIPGPGGGAALAVRQNHPGERHPWLALGSRRTVAAWATDARQLDLGCDLPGERLQHEHTLVVLQDEAVRLAPGRACRGAFVGVYVPDHPAATGPGDAALLGPWAWDVGDPLPEGEGEGCARPAVPVVATLFAPARVRAVDALPPDDVAALAGGEPRLVERAPGPRRPGEGDDGTRAAQMWSCFGPDGRHVVTAAKEAAVLRPHGHVLLGAAGRLPGPEVTAATAWMDGVFLSQVTQGHASSDAVLTLRRGYVAPAAAAGLRMFVREPGGGWELLGRPSAWVVGLDDCRWVYASGERRLEVAVETDPAEPVLRLRAEVAVGPDVEILVAVGLESPGDAETPKVEALPGGVRVGLPAGSPLADRYPEGGWSLTWAADAACAVADDAPLFADGVSRALPWLTVATPPTRRVALELRLDLVGLGGCRPSPVPPAGRGPDESVRVPPGHVHAAEVSALAMVLPWFRHDARVHYLAPRGLEQYTGGAWGTRDVCQGPVGLLLADGDGDALREVVRLVFAGQQTDGTWPQWFDVHPRHRAPGRRECHGDVPYWPLLALGEYLSCTGDAGLLREAVESVGEETFAEATPILDHVVAALDTLTVAVTSDPRLPAYGHGDWNDSLQPADPALASAMTSAWTTVLRVHALRTLAGGLDAAGAEPALAGRCRDLADSTAAALHERLLVDHELVGYLVLPDDGPPEPLVHPRDTRTGLRHSLLAPIHAIAADLLDPDAAARHLRMIGDHLLGPDGARLFDAPAAYRGGPMEVFQRAEAASFFGREVGLAYTHAHLRYVEALARHGDAAAAWTALLAVVPIGVTGRVRGALPRQATCYFSSSDGAFPDRDAAARDYARLLRGDAATEGGWRVYSSGPGLFLRLLTESILGIRRRADSLEVDPCLAPSLHGIEADVPLDGGVIAVVRYAVGPAGSGVRAVTAEGVSLPTAPLTNPYRAPGVRIDLSELTPHVRDGRIRLDVETG